MPDDVRIDRLVLDVPGLSRGEGQKLAALVGSGLSRLSAGTHETLAVALDAIPGETSDRLAARIVNELLRQIG